MNFNEKALLDNAIEAWMRHHRMTYSFLKKLNDSQLYADILKPDLTSYAKHYEEMINVQTAYANGFLVGKLDFSGLPPDSSYKGEKTKEELFLDFQNADALILENINQCPPERTIEIFGNQCSRIDLIHTLLHHELFHHGMFSVFSYQMEFNLPKDWNDFWWTIAPFDQ